MQRVCHNCDLGLKRSDCSDLEYIECECRRWLIENIRYTTPLRFIHTIDEALEEAYDNKDDLRKIKLRMIEYLARTIQNEFS